MGKGTNSNDNSVIRSYSWDEIKKHTTKDDKWLVLNGHIYDITRFSKRHPGGARVISHFAGQDGTEVWTAFHNDLDYVSKFLKPILVGKVADEKEDEIDEDLRQLRQLCVDKGWFKVKPWFYIAHIVHILLLDVLAYYVLSTYGNGWVPWFTAVLLLATVQAQAGWTQHDYGHLSVFNSRRVNHWMHWFVIGHIKAASSHWWNFRHYQHHAKPNVFIKDPDITLPYVFLIGDKMPKMWAEKRKGFMPYRWQHQYFHFIGPPTLLTIYFHVENIYFVLKRKEWKDMCWMLSMFVRWHLTYGQLLGLWGSFWLYMSMRFVESHWFTYVTQMSHIPMEIDKDKQRNWFTSQLYSTCNVEQGLFNDWFTGHLNFQIEHHLFPLMPRHNYHLVAPYVKSLCKKHNVPYTCKTLTQAFADIVRSLKKSGEIWYNAYNETG